MKELLAKTMVSIAGEEEMTKGGFIKEAELCKLIWEGLFEADDMPGISAFERCKRRLVLIEWLNKDVNLGAFPPYGNYIKGMSHILYEGLRTSQEGKLYLYALANSGTYYVRAPNTLCSESFFSSMQETDPWGQGILSSSGVQKHISDFTTITSMKMEDSRYLDIKCYLIPCITNLLNFMYHTLLPITHINGLYVTLLLKDNIFLG
ncbi:hypothetical protein DPMN_023904 [Dreissena polymorpha]|uniref:Uncharacterized protein n=1 Tax=Dreissena polymorpha TaxID=45954 RepID=A0A9D4LM04_DREPO|nr:hypothetical protein DPMN_023904 [Dreissena polymorpha]